MNFLSSKKSIFCIFFAVLIFSSCQDPQTVEPTDKTQNLTTNYDSNVAKEWIQIYMDIEKDLPGFRPAATSRALAYIWMAAYEAGLPGMPNFNSNDTKLNGLVVPDFTKDVNKMHWGVAVNAAVAKTTDHFMGHVSNDAQKGLIKDLENTLNGNFSKTVSPEIFTNSQEWGRLVAEAVIAYSKTDAEAEKQILDPFPASYVPPTGEGKWSGKALFPYWGKVRTFTTPNSLVSPPPPAYSIVPTSTYFRDFKEVNDDFVNMDHEKRWRAEFWSDDIVGLTFSPPARIFQIANQMIDNENFNLEKTLHLLLKLGLAENDAAAAAWGSKYVYNVERPIHFIVPNINVNFKPILGDAIGNTGLTPPFPGYPSGHSTFGGLGISVLSAFFGENYTFTDRCHYGRSEFIGTPRTYTTQTQIGEENAFSRIPLGVHPRFDCTEGLRLGKLIGQNAVDYDVTKN